MNYEDQDQDHLHDDQDEFDNHGDHCTNDEYDHKDQNHLHDDHEDCDNDEHDHDDQEEVGRLYLNTNDTDIVNLFPAGVVFHQWFLYFEWFCSS